MSSVQDSLFWPGLHYDRNYADGCPARRIEHTSRTVYTILLHALKNNCGERWFVDLQMTAIRDSYGVLILDYVRSFLTESFEYVDDCRDSVFLI